MAYGPPMAMLLRMLEKDRMRSGWSVGQLAWRLGITVREYQEVGAGERWPNGETFNRICELYGWPQSFVGAAGLTGKGRGRSRREVAGGLRVPAASYFVPPRTLRSASSPSVPEKPAAARAVTRQHHLTASDPFSLETAPRGTLPEVPPGLRRAVEPSDAAGLR